MKNILIIDPSQYSEKKSYDELEKLTKHYPIKIIDLFYPWFELLSEYPKRAHQQTFRLSSDELIRLMEIDSRVVYSKNFKRYSSNARSIYNFHERKTYFGNVFNQVNYFLMENEIDCIIFKIRPHIGIDYMFYLAAINQKICIYMPVNNFNNNGLMIVKDLNNKHFVENKLDDYEFNLSTDNLWYMNRHNNGKNISLHVFRKNLKRIWFQKIRYRSVYRKACKVSSHGYGVSNLQGIENLESDLTDIVFPLHKDPELTSSVLAHDNLTQIEIIEYLASFKNVKVWILENPKQSSLFRSGDFFDRLNRLHNVYYSDTLRPSSFFGKNVIFSTISGTIGIEALHRGHKVICFGMAYWSCVYGVLNYPFTEFDFKKFKDIDWDNNLMEQSLNRLTRKFHNLPSKKIGKEFIMLALDDFFK